MGPIAKLATEILELIALEAVSVVTPPGTVDTITGNGRLRWRQEMQSGKSILVGLLAPRLMSRHFHKVSWKAFGKVLGGTVVDLHSP